jgi:oligoendopeptidase F
MTDTTTTAAASMPKRADAPREQTWAIETVFATPAEWDAAYTTLNGQLGDLGEFRGELGSSARTLLDALRRREEVELQAWRLHLYASMRAATDATDPEALALLGRAGGIAAQASAALAYFEPELLQIEPATLERFMTELPDLTVQRHYFDRLQRRRAHVRSSEVEELLAQVSEPLDSFYTIHTALADADLSLGQITDAQGQTVQLGQANHGEYLHSADRSVRQAAWEAMMDAYLSMKNTFAANYAGSVKRDVFLMRARNYPSSLEASLAPEAIPQEVFYNLLDTVWKNLPIWQRYFKVRAKLLGIEQAHGWDISEAPLPRPNAKPVPITFDEGVELIAASLAPLGDEYVGIVRKGIQDRWVDYANNAGKVGGAFSTGMPGEHPFILMSWQDELGAVSTLAHELGHSLHSYYANAAQPLVYADYSMFVAEVASNMNQALMGAHLLETVDDPNFLITIIEERMGNNLRYLFTMPILAKFELDCHERVERGEALTAEGMIDALADLYAQGYGDAVALDHDRMGINWARFTHLFANFYVFQYATGISAAAQLAQQVRAGGPEAAQRYIDFLKTGGSEYPVEALKKAGIDMSKPEPVQAAFDILASYVDKLEQLIG